YAAAADRRAQFRHGGGGAGQQGRRRRTARRRDPLRALRTAISGTAPSFHPALAGWRTVPRQPLTNAAAPDQIDDGQQDDGADQRNQERIDSKRGVVDRTARKDQPADEGADDADDNIQQDPLL